MKRRVYGPDLQVCIPRQVLTSIAAQHCYFFLGGAGTEINISSSDYEWK